MFANLLFFGTAFLAKAQSVPVEMSVLAPDLVTVMIVDGVFHHLDLKNSTMYIAIDKQGKILQKVQLGRLESVYLIQGRQEKLKSLLTGGSVGAAVGLSSIFWGNLIGLVKDSKDNNSSDQNSDKFNATNLIVRVAGGAGVGLLVGYLKDQGDDDVRTFPVYDPKIKQTNPSPSINFNSLDNLGRMLREKESFVHVTLKASEEK